MSFNGHCYTAQTRGPFKGHFFHFQWVHSICCLITCIRHFKGNNLGYFNVELLIAYLTPTTWRSLMPFKGHFFHFQLVHSICCLITCIRCLHETGPKGLELCQQHVFAFNTPFFTPEYYFKN